MRLGATMMPQEEFDAIQQYNDPIGPPQYGAVQQYDTAVGPMPAPMQTAMPMNTASVFGGDMPWYMWAAIAFGAYYMFGDQLLGKKGRRRRR